MSGRQTILRKRNAMTGIGVIGIEDRSRKRRTDKMKRDVKRLNAVSLMGKKFQKS